MPDQLDSRDTARVERAAWKFATYAHAIDRSRAWLYGLPPERQPRSVKIGRSRFIVEKPEEFLRRLAETA